MVEAQDTSRPRRGLMFLLVAVMWAAIYLPRLGDVPLRGEEPTRAMPASVMIRTGNWIVPSVDGKDYFNKPPMVNWLVAASYLITGTVNEFTARLPSVVMILAFVSLVVLMPSKWLDPPGQIAVAVISMTTILMVERGRQIEIEATYVAFTGMAVLWWLNVWAAKGSRWKLWIVPALFLAAGALAKGPFLGLVFYSVVAGVLLHERRLRELISIQHICAAVLICMICLGWVFWAKADSSGHQMTSQWSKQLGPRVIPSFKTFDLHRTIPGTLQDFLPWALFLPLLWVKHFTSLIPADQQRMFKGCRLGMVVGFFLLAAMPNAVPRYVMPIQPVMALMIGWVLGRHRESIPSDRIWLWAIIGGLTLEAAVAVGGLIGFNRGPWAWAALAVALAALAAALRYRAKLIGGARLAVATAMAAVVAVWLYFGFVVPMVIARDEYRPPARHINSVVPVGQATYIFKPARQAYVFSIRPPVKYVYSAKQLGPDVRYLVVPDADSNSPGLAEALAARDAQCIYPFKSKYCYKLMKLGPAKAVETQPGATPVAANSPKPKATAKEIKKPQKNVQR